MDFSWIGYDECMLISIYCIQKPPFVCSNYDKSKNYATLCPNKVHLGWVLKSSIFYKKRQQESLDFYLITRRYNKVSKNAKNFLIYSVFENIIFWYRIWRMVHIVLYKHVLKGKLHLKECSQDVYNHTCALNYFPNFFPLN